MDTFTPCRFTLPTETAPRMAEVRTYAPSKLTVATCPAVTMVAALEVEENVASVA